MDDRKRDHMLGLDMERISKRKDRQEIYDYITMMLTTNGYHFGAAIASYQLGYEPQTIKAIYKAQKRSA